MALSVCYFCEHGMWTKYLSFPLHDAECVSPLPIPASPRAGHTQRLPGNSIWGAKQRTGPGGEGSLRRTSYVRVGLLLFLPPLCLPFFASPMMLFLGFQFPFLIKRRKNPVLFKNKRDDSTGLLSAKWLPVITCVTVFLTEAGLWTQGETAPPDAHLP